jgi:hypothetical protein
MVSFYINNKIISDNIKTTDSQKKLSICLETNGFSFTVIDKNNKMLAFGDIACVFPETLSQIITLVKQVFANLGIEYSLMDEVELIVPSNKCTWIPESLFDTTHIREYFNVLSPLEVKETVFYTYSEKLQAYSVFTYVDVIVSAFKVVMPGIKVRSQQSKMLDTLLLEKSRMKSIVEIYVRKKEFEIAVFDNKSLVLSNIFKYGNNSDISYLILLVLKHLNINKDAMELYISGMVDRDMFTSVERFFPKVILYVGKKVDFSDNEMYRIPLYQYSMLLR